MDAMVEPPSSKAKPDDIATQLDRTAADLRTLAEQLGAVRPGPPRVVSPRRAKITFAVVVALAALVCWLVWEHWHSLRAAAARAATSWAVRRRRGSGRRRCGLRARPMRHSPLRRARTTS